MNIKQLVYIMVLMTCPLYAMKRQYTECTYDKSQEQQTWLSQLQDQYLKKSRVPFGREVRKMKKMWKLIPIEEQGEIITFLNQAKIVTPKYLHKDTSMSISSAALTKKYDQNMTLMSYCDNLLRVKVDKAATSLAQEVLKNPTPQGRAKLFVLLQIRQIDQQSNAGTKLTKALSGMTKYYLEAVALQPLNDTDNPADTILVEQ